MFFVELFGQKGDRLSKLKNIGLVDLYVPKVVEIDRVVFPPALSTDIITEVYCVKKTLLRPGDSKVYISTKFSNGFLNDHYTL